MSSQLLSIPRTVIGTSIAQPVATVKALGVTPDATCINPEPALPEFSPVILLSRPRAQAEAFADDLRKRFGEDLRIEISPILEIEFLSPEVTLPVVAAYVFTSRNAVLAWEASGMACQ